MRPTGGPCLPLGMRFAPHVTESSVGSSLETVLYRGQFSIGNVLYGDGCVPGRFACKPFRMNGDNQSLRHVETSPVKEAVSSLRRHGKKAQNSKTGGFALVTLTLRRCGLRRISPSCDSPLSGVSCPAVGARSLRNITGAPIGHRFVSGMSMKQPR